MIISAGDGPPEEIGGKAAGLARLIALGLPVPRTLVVPVSDGGELDDPGDLIAELAEPLAVRSSAVGEDANDRSAAGQYESVLGVMRADLPAMVKQVYHSSRSARVTAYHGAPTTAMAVVIQSEVASTRAGVAFSRDPVTGAEEVAVECAFGGGERLVSGAVNPDRYRVLADGTVRARLAMRDGTDPRRTLRSLRRDEVLAVAALLRRAEEGFGHPVDVEFCFDAGPPRPRLWLLQCRPITALGGSG